MSVGSHLSDEGPAVDWLHEDRFVIDQLIRPVANLYRVSASGRPIAFVRQKKLAIKEDIRFYADEAQTQELFRIKARKVMELSGRYELTIPAGERIGAIEKVFSKSLFRSTWRVIGPLDEELGIAKERSAPVAVLRRVIDAVPYGEFVPIIFHFTIDEGERHLGDFTRRIGMRDTYDLDLTPDSERTIDRRLGIALGVGLDALQSR